MKDCLGVFLMMPSLGEGFPSLLIPTPFLPLSLLLFLFPGFFGCLFADGSSLCADGDLVEGREHRRRRGKCELDGWMDGLVSGRWV